MRTDLAAMVVATVLVAGCGLDLLDPESDPDPDAYASVWIESFHDELWGYDLEVRLVGMSSPTVRLEGGELEADWLNDFTVVFAKNRHSLPSPTTLRLSLPGVSGEEIEIRIPSASRLGPQRIEFNDEDEALVLPFANLPIQETVLRNAEWQLSIQNADGIVVLSMQGGRPIESPLVVPMSILVPEVEEDRWLTVNLRLFHAYETENPGYPVSVRTLQEIVWETNPPGPLPDG